MTGLLAQVNLGNTPLGTGRSLESTYPTAGTLVNVIIRTSFVVVGIILTVVLIYGGIQFIISAGTNDSKKLAQAQQVIIDALIGLVVVIMAFFIIQLIEKITGLSILSSNL